MADVELLSYEIRKINMFNSMLDSAKIQIESTMNFNIKYGQDNELAVAVLTVQVRHRQHPDMLCIELDIQGTFRLTGIENAKSKREVHVKCYDELFPFANQIMTYLAMNSGMQGFMLKKFPIEFADVNFGAKPENSVNSGKVIKLWSDI